jgi:hypothetical protein
MANLSKTDESSNRFVTNLGRFSVLNCPPSAGPKAEGILNEKRLTQPVTGGRFTVFYNNPNNNSQQPTTQPIPGVKPLNPTK